MFRQKTLICHIFVAALATVVFALEHYDNFREGRCSDYPVEGAKSSRKFVDSLKYIVAGSRYHIYRSASALGPSQYGELSGNQVVQRACLTRNTTSSVFDSIGSIFGFGRSYPLVSLRIVTRPGIYFEGIPRHPLTNSTGLTQTVTLTDNRSFAFTVICWTGSALEERAWNVLSNTPNLDLSTRRAIEEHATSLGFRRENFVYLNHNRCLQNNYIG